MLLLLVRHGESRANVEAIIQGPDDPLTDRGRAQAAALGTYLAETYRIDAIYASAMDRARETARIAADSLTAPITIVPELAEINAGHAIGRSWADWRADDPDRAARWAWTQRRATDAWDGGESGETFCARIFPALDAIITRHTATNDTVAVVTHGGVIAWFAARLLGDPLDVWPARHGGFVNCSVTEVFVASDGTMLPGAWNIDPAADV